MTLLSLLLLAVSPAAALDAPPTTVVLAGPLDEAEAVLASGLGVAVEVVEPVDAIERVELRSVVGRGGDGDCGGPVPVTRWREDAELARKALLRLDFGGALDRFVQLELEMVCLQGVPGASDLVRLELGLATAHHYAGRAAGADPQRRAFHAAESQAALERAAAWSRGLAIPPDLDPELAPALETARRKLAILPTARVVLAGPGAGEGVRLNGRPAAAGVADLAGGTVLVQVTRGLDVVAAAIVPVPGGRTTLVWVAPGGRPLTGGALLQEVAALQGGDADRETEARLAALLDALGGEPPALLVTTDDAGWTAWAAEGDGLARRESGSRPRAYADWRWGWGLGAGAAGSTVDGDSLGGVAPGLEGLGGVGPAIGAWGRFRPVDRVAVSLSVAPATVPSPLPVDQGGGTLFRATVPVRAGGRWLEPVGLYDVEVGLDAGACFFGRYGKERVAPIGALAFGVAGPLGADARGRAELHAGVGPGYGFGGLLVGLEGVR